jgi:hypothetical protein
MNIFNEGTFEDPEAGLREACATRWAYDIRNQINAGAPSFAGENNGPERTLSLWERKEIQTLSRTPYTIGWDAGVVQSE